MVVAFREQPQAIVDGCGLVKRAKLDERLDEIGRHRERARLVDLLAHGVLPHRAKAVDGGFQIAGEQGDDPRSPARLELLEARAHRQRPLQRYPVLGLVGHAAADGEKRTAPLVHRPAERAVADERGEPVSYALIRLHRGSSRASSRSALRSASLTACASGGASDGSARSSATSSALRCGEGSPRPRSSMPSSRSIRPAYESSASAPLGRARKTRSPCSSAARMPAPQSVVLPAPGPR